MKFVNNAIVLWFYVYHESIKCGEFVTLLTNTKMLPMYIYMYKNIYYSVYKTDLTA